MLQERWIHAHHCFPEWPVLEWRRQGFGTTIKLDRLAENWIHVGFDYQGYLHAVHYLFDARGSSAIRDVLVFSGRDLIGQRNGLNAYGDHSYALDADNGIVVDADVRRGLGLSLHVFAGSNEGGSEIFFAAFGADG